MIDQNASTGSSNLIAALDQLSNTIGRGLTRRMTAAGERLRGSEGRILHLIEAEGSRPKALAEGAWISKQAISRRIGDMENRGLVTVAPDPGDGRAVLVRRTGEGERLREFTLEQITDLEDEFARIVGAERYTVFREVLDALVRG